jgi:DNA-binding CsgD family transcriptional regulator
MAALFLAEQGRCEAAPRQTETWSNAVARAYDAGLRWDHAVASWRLAAAILQEDGGRSVAGPPLRNAYEYAMKNDAAPLRAKIEQTARLYRVRLHEPAALALRAEACELPGPFSSLTPREREVLGDLVAGLTYPEIGRALFISEKTVSAHVSNILHKTNSRSRQEVAALAIRLGLFKDTKG